MISLLIGFIFHGWSKKRIYKGIESSHHLPGFPGRLRLRLLPAAGGALGPPEAEEVRLELDMLLLLS